MITIQFNKCIIDPRNTAGPPVSCITIRVSIIITRSCASNIRTLRNYETKAPTKPLYLLENTQNTQNYNFTPCKCWCES